MRRVKRLILVLALFLGYASSGFGQQLHGTVRDSLGAPLPYAGVNLKNVKGVITGYALTAADGTYHLDAGAVSDTGLLLEASCLGYRPQAVRVTGKTVYNFRLYPSAKQLKEVTIKDDRPFLKVRGDTLNYKVSDFAAPQDRVIGDVIKRLPGITVDDKGKISYQGKPISQLYIGGDNLLDDKYNIATNTVPNGVVDTIQVLQNNQPVKALQGKVFSDDIALNITIKKGARAQLLGRIGLVAGIPGKYDADASALLFKDNYKAINYIKANNTGNDVANDLIAHNAEDYLKGIDVAPPPALLALGTAGSPDLPENRYLFNQVELFNANNLLKLKHDVQLKLNVSYLHDNRRQRFSEVSKTYISGDTVAYTEQQNNMISPDRLAMQANVNINKTTYYLNERLTADADDNSSGSATLQNGLSSQQRLMNNQYRFTNELSYVRTPTAGWLFTLFSHTSYTSNPENLEILPGPEATAFNQGQPYQGIVQAVNLPTLQTSNYLLVKRPLTSALSLGFKGGINIQKQQLNSSLTTFTGRAGLQVDSGRNDLHWLRSRYYAEPGLSYGASGLQLQLDVPMILEQTAYTEDLYALDQHYSGLYLNPIFKFHYNLGLENFLDGSYRFSNSLSNSNDLYRGYILTDYRTLNSNEVSLDNIDIQDAGIGFHYRKAVAILFADINATYTRTNAPFIHYSTISSSFQQQETLPLANAANSWTISSDISKYLFFLHGTLRAGLLWQSNTAEVVENNILLPTKNTMERLTLGWMMKVGRHVNLDYTGWFSHAVSETAAATTTYNQAKQQISLNYMPGANFVFSALDDLYYLDVPGSQNTTYTFLDLTGRYMITSQKIDLELRLQNLANVRTFNTAYLLQNNFTTTQYTIPGRMLLLRVTFNY